MEAVGLNLCAVSTRLEDEPALSRSLKAKQVGAGRIEPILVDRLELSVLDRGRDGLVRASAKAGNLDVMAPRKSKLSNSAGGESGKKQRKTANPHTAILLAEWCNRKTKLKLPAFFTISYGHHVEVAIKSPLIQAVLEPRESPLREFIDDGNLRAAQIDGADLEGTIAANFRLEQSRLTRVNLASAILTRARILDLRFDGCNLSNAEFESSELGRVVLTECRMTGVQFGQAELRDVVMEDAKLDFANFRMANFARCAFRRCNLKGADFASTTLKEVSFEECDLEGVTFQRAEMDEVDLRSSQVVGLASSNGLNGAIVDPLQLLDLAPLLAREAGLRVE
jgi:uncharacterized protein YjbI with pentapeptide repeats